MVINKVHSNYLNRLKLIAIFCNVINSGSMRQAAKNLNMTAPAVSQFISQLEAELGITLIYRTTRKISLSEAGKQYYQQGQKILRAAEQAENVINELKQSLHGELRISLPVGLATSPIAEALTVLLKEKPELRLSIIASDEYVDLVAERIDLAIRVGKPEDSGFIYHALADLDKNIYASPSYLAEHDAIKKPDDLTLHSWLRLSLRQHLTLNDIKLNHPQYQTVSLSPKSRMEFNDLNALIAHVKHGLGIAVLPELEIKQLLKDDALVAVLPDWSMEKYHLYALTMDKKPSFKVKVVLDTLKKYFSVQKKH